MKSASIGWKLPVFIGSLVIVALIFNVYFFNRAKEQRETQVKEERKATADAEAKQAAAKLAKEKKQAEAKRVRDEAEAKAKAEKDAAAEHARFLARYLNAGAPVQSGVATIGVVMESENGTMNPGLASALAARLKNGEVRLLNSFFRPEFVADHYVSRLFSGDTAVFDRLELTNSLNAVLSGRQSVSYTTNTELQNTVTADMQLEVMTVPVGLTRDSQSWNFAANGVGFRPHEARQMAEERIIEQIAKSTNLVLAPKF